MTSWLPLSLCSRTTLLGYSGSVVIALAQDYGREKYRYRRYVQAERAWKAFVQSKEK